MRNYYESVYPIEAIILPEHGVVQAYPQPGLWLGAHITIEAMHALILKSDGLIYTPDEIARRANEFAEAILRVMP